ncbi:MAG: thioesterase family protein [Syntrophobacteraceae bacterium]|nr:thioesterase family protein [Syntrophobacteraceae bacterium]
MSEPLRKKIFTDPEGKGDSDSFYHITRLRIPLFEVDLGQALYHGNYYHLFELGREDMLRTAGFPYREFINRELHLTIVEAQCKYRKFLRYDDQIELYTQVTRMGRRSLSFSQLIYRPVAPPADGKAKGQGVELCTQCRLDMVCVQFTGRSTLLPDDFRQAIEGMQNNESVNR